MWLGMPAEAPLASRWPLITHFLEYSLLLNSIPSVPSLLPNHFRSRSGTGWCSRQDCEPPIHPPLWLSALTLYPVDPGGPVANI